MSNPPFYYFQKVTSPYTFVANYGGKFTFAVRAWGEKNGEEALGEPGLSEFVIVVDINTPDYKCCDGVCYKKTSDGVYEKIN